ncbi:unnamed protein product [Closterium sp. NIES-54]
MSLEVWITKHGPTSAQTPVSLPTAIQLFAAEDDDQHDAKDAPLPPLRIPAVPPSTASSPSAVASPPLTVANLPNSAFTSATGDEGSNGASPTALASGIDGGQHT